MGFVVNKRKSSSSSKLLWVLLFIVAGAVLGLYYLMNRQVAVKEEAVTPNIKCKEGAVRVIGCEGDRAKKITRCVNGMWSRPYTIECNYGTVCKEGECVSDTQSQGDQGSRGSEGGQGGQGAEEGIGGQGELCDPAEIGACKSLGGTPICRNGTVYCLEGTVTPEDQGDQGGQGSQGDQGDQGGQGSQGDQGDQGGQGSQGNEEGQQDQCQVDSQCGEGCRCLASDNGNYCYCLPQTGGAECDPTYKIPVYIKEFTQTSGTCTGDEYMASYKIVVQADPADKKECGGGTFKLTLDFPSFVSGYITNASGAASVNADKVVWTKSTPDVNTLTFTANISVPKTKITDSKITAVAILTPDPNQHTKEGGPLQRTVSSSVGACYTQTNNQPTNSPTNSPTPTPVSTNTQPTPPPTGVEDMVPAVIFVMVLAAAVAEFQFGFMSRLLSQAPYIDAEGNIRIE